MDVSHLSLFTDHESLVTHHFFGPITNHSSLITIHFLPRPSLNSVKGRGRVKQIYAAFMSPWDVDKVFTSPWDVDEVFTLSTLNSFPANFLLLN